MNQTETKRKDTPTPVGHEGWVDFYLILNRFYIYVAAAAAAMSNGAKIAQGAHFAIVAPFVKEKGQSRFGSN